MFTRFLGVLCCVAACLGVFSCAALPGGSVTEAQKMILEVPGTTGPGSGATTRTWDDMERLTVELSFIAMAGFWQTNAEDVARAVGELFARMLPRQELIWGPAVHMPGDGGVNLVPQLSDALVFISRDRTSGEYFVVFRGTNPVSSAEWLFQDFMVKTQVPWLGIQDGPAPADALVSEGTATALGLRLELFPVQGFPGDEKSFAQVLAEIPGKTPGNCVMHFTGHSLGGLLAPVVALWLRDHLEHEGLNDLVARYQPRVFAYAGPTPGNRAFAAYLESRLGMVRRYANRLDIAACAWNLATMETLPDLYKPQTDMQPLTRSLYEFCMGLVRDREYVQPWSVIDVPSELVPAEVNLYLLQAAWQHVVPYLDMLEPGRKDMILQDVLAPLTELVQVPGLPPFDLRDLYGSEGDASGN